MTTYTATYSPDDNKLRLTASQRLDDETYARVKAAGFSWAPKLEQFIAPMWTPGRAALCVELAGEIDDDDQTLTERADERAERFGDYSERRGDEAERARDYVAQITDGIPLGQPILVGHHSERHARKNAKRIETGMRRAVQLFDTAAYWKLRAASAIRHAKYKELPAVRHRRIKGIEADQRRNAKHAAEVGAMLKRWAGLHEADSITRKDGTPTTFAERALFVAGWESGNVTRCYPLAEFPRDPPASQYEGSMSIYSALHGSVITAEQAQAVVLAALPPRLAYSEQWAAHYANRLEYERAMLGESGGIAANAFDLAVGGRVLVGGEWCFILRINRAAGAVVSVTTTARYVSVRGVEDIKDYRPPTEADAAAVAKVTKLAPICNYRSADAVEMTQAQWAAICKDHKGTHTHSATDTTQAHRRRQVQGFVARQFRAEGQVIAGEQWALVPVFITDAPAKAAPLIGAKPPEAPVTITREFEPAAVREPSAAPAPTPAAVEVAAMRESLRAGVQIVSAPQLFPTPPDLAARMIEAAEVRPGHRVLEPSAGTGRILDALAAGVTFRSDRRSVEFREMVAARGGTIEALPADTFKASGTSVSTVMVVFDEPDYVRHLGRMFRVLARFPEADCDGANRYMADHPGASLLAIIDGEAILAHADDRGVTGETLASSEHYEVIA